MGLYERRVLPRLVHFVCGREPATRLRREMVPLAAGEVLELGFGSGLNLPHYDATRVTRVHALEPSEAMWELAAPAVRSSRVPVDCRLGSAQEIPLASRSVDSVLVTFTLCTVPDAPAALREAARVLRPGGRLVFCEHGAAPDPEVRRWQRRIDPLWTRLAGGCHLDREIPALVAASGFRIESLAARYLPGWKVASYFYQGTAVCG